MYLTLHNAGYAIKRLFTWYLSHQKLREWRSEGPNLFFRVNAKKQKILGSAVCMISGTTTKKSNSAPLTGSLKLRVRVFWFSLHPTQFRRVLKTQKAQLYIGVNYKNFLVYIGVNVKCLHQSCNHFAPHSNFKRLFSVPFPFGKLNFNLLHITVPSLIFSKSFKRVPLQTN